MLVVFFIFSTVIAGTSTSMIDRTSGDGRSRQPNPEARPDQAATCINRNCDDRAANKKEMNGDAPFERNCNGDAFGSFSYGKETSYCFKISG